MANDDPTQDDAYNALVQSFITPRSGPYDDSLPPTDGTNAGQLPYLNYMANLPTPTTEDFSHLRADRMLNAAEQAQNAMSDSPPTEDNDLEKLIPKVYNKSATKDELMRFYKLTGTDL